MQMVRAERRRQGGSPVIEHPFGQKGPHDWVGEAVRERPESESLVSRESHEDRVVQERQPGRFCGYLCSESEKVQISRLS